MKKVIKVLLLSIVLVCIPVLPVKAATYTHTIYYYDFRGEYQVPDAYDSTSSFKPFTVIDNGKFKISSGTPCGYNIQGWQLFRLKDQKWYVAGQGWKSVDELLPGIEPRVYKPGEELTLGSSWTNGCVNSNYAFVMVGEYDTYTISFNPNGGSGTFETMYPWYQHMIDIPWDTPYKAGYNFKGWALKRLCDNKWYVAGQGWKTQTEINSNNYQYRIYNPGEELEVGYSWVKGETSRKGFTFYAQWTPKSYDIAYDLNGGSGSFSTIHTSYYSTFTISSSKPTRDGYNFEGWNMVRNQDNKIYVAGQGWKTASEIKNGGLTARLYAPGESLTFGASCIEGGVEDSNFTYKAVWTEKTAIVVTHDTQIIHNYSSEYTVDTAPTCESAGIESRHCKSCGVSLKSSERTISPLGHDWSDWDITVPPTETTAGSKARYCRRCSKSESAVIPATGTSSTSDPSQDPSQHGSDPSEQGDHSNYTESSSNNTMGTADGVTVDSGCSYSGSLGAYEDNDPDWFTFTLQQGSEVQMEVYAYNTTQDSRFNVEFYAPDRTEYAQWEFDVTFNENLGYHYGKETLYLAEGTYYVKLRSSKNPFHSYVISFPNTVAYESFREPNDTIGTATKAGNGKVYNGMISSWSDPEDVDFFFVNVPSEGTYYVTLENVSVEDSTAFGAQLFIDTFDEDGEPVQRINGSFSGEVGRGKKLKVETKLPEGETYFKISSGSYLYVPYSGEYKFSITKKPAKVKGLKVTKKSKNSVKITWKKQAEASGYKIYRSTKKNKGYKCIKTIKKGSTTSFINKGLKKGKRYYYKIRAYRTVNGYTCPGILSGLKSKKL